MMVETVRGYYLGWYNDVLTESITIREGQLELSDHPGLGAALREEVFQRPDAHVEVTTTQDVREPVPPTEQTGGQSMSRP
jgi:hypothetical protein